MSPELQDTGTLVDFYGKIQKASSAEDLANQLVKAVRSYGFDNCSIIYLPLRDDIRHRPHFVTPDWPRELLDAYERGEFFKGNRLFSRLRTQTSPLKIDIEAMTQSSGTADPIGEDSPEIVALFRKHNRLREVFFPCTDSRGRKGAISVSGNRPLPSNEELATLHLFSQFAFSQLHFVLNETSRRTELTKREEDCLNWSARGKTIAECSIILGISENTVASYLASTSRKLSARNKAHMIAIAYEKGLLNRHFDIRPV